MSYDFGLYVAFMALIFSGLGLYMDRACREGLRKDKKDRPWS